MTSCCRYRGANLDKIIPWMPRTMEINDIGKYTLNHFIWPLVLVCYDGHLFTIHMRMQCLHKLPKLYPIASVLITEQNSKCNWQSIAIGCATICWIQMYMYQIANGQCQLGIHPAACSLFVEQFQDQTESLQQIESYPPLIRIAPWQNPYFYPSTFVERVLQQTPHW